MEAIRSKILKVLANALQFTADLGTIARTLGKAKTTISPELSRLKKAGFVYNPQRGIWQLLKIYRKIRHTKRVKDTSKGTFAKDPYLDLEITSVGFVPYRGFPLPPDKPSKRIIKQFGDLLNPMLVMAAYDELLNQDFQEEALIYLKGFFVTEDNPDPLHKTDVKDHTTVTIAKAGGKFAVEGTEFLMEVTSKFDGNHDVVITFVNNLGRHYTFITSFEIGENDFNGIR